MSGISGIFILNNKGRVIIQRVYRADLQVHVIETFNKKLVEFDEFNQKPIVQDEFGNTYIYRNHNNLTFLIITRRNTNVMMVFAFLYQFIEVLVHYFKELEEESVRDNFVVIYELLDEVLDNGYPQITDCKNLSEFIKTESHELVKDSFFGGKEKKEENLSKYATMSTAAISWRPEGIKYKKNEIFLDVYEKLNMLIGKTGNVIEAEIIGNVVANSMLSGMPDCKLGLNDKAYFEAIGRSTNARTINFEDMKFHQCVRLSKFENERLITFIPPDGEFELISYRIPVQIKPLFQVDVIITQPKPTKIEIMVKAKSNFKEKSTANDVDIYIPVPEDVQKPEFKCAFGKSIWDQGREAIKWSFKQFVGQKEYIMQCTFNLPTVASPGREKYKQVPISINFEIPYYTVSGFQVRYLKVEERSGYNALPWVRYVTKNGDYQIRMF
ncbi:clathrin adapter protein AP-1, mu subunit (macronuclear) [Tetrahymena thermophila SB210]|uniref:Clathrin adapter protein AP-1, mu subunit n=2 Tax=Tetrahymena thermophila TaxID=5911 RepID=I7MI48_TETTS|nr:clathrin adapter protein AP-1, mu subunit [Tetrahymena thermophila SB210]ABB13589.1 Apm1Bp [Tetrahymena thermophila]EAS03891.2 clathrin adapter protein AP-1, mu subunit [Tetrahymena thermophila SB210]|eukprot:XP_001024136.2 clathrin adapter protein AP-1, mu subunit [Tetrahymena thermophila SB210]